MYVFLQSYIKNSFLKQVFKHRDIAWKSQSQNNHRLRLEFKRNYACDKLFHLLLTYMINIDATTFFFLVYIELYMEITCLPGLVKILNFFRQTMTG